MNNKLCGKDSYQKGYAKLLDYLLQFALARQLENRYPTSTPSSFTIVSCTQENELRTGDLVLVSFANAGKWRLSWLIDERHRKDGEMEYLLASAEDGEQSWWTNIGLAYFSRNDVKNHPEWRWNDKQYDFAKQWQAISQKEEDYLYRGYVDHFDGIGVVVVLLARFSANNDSVLHTIENWPDISNKELTRLYVQLRQTLEQQRNQRKEQP